MLHVKWPFRWKKIKEKITSTLKIQLTTNKINNMFYGSIQTLILIRFGIFFVASLFLSQLSIEFEFEHFNTLEPILPGGIDAIWMNEKWNLNNNIACTQNVRIAFFVQDLVQAQNWYIKRNWVSLLLILAVIDWFIFRFSVFYRFCFVSLLISSFISNCG